VIVLDTSAVVAVIRLESDAERIAACIVGADVVMFSAASLVETSIVLGDKRLGGPAAGDKLLDEFLTREHVVVEPVTVEQAQLARIAFRRYGKGTGQGAALNFGDCFSYALAKSLDVPLLYKGGDFAKTDIVSALA
jgi:ribonuclease VapC